MFRNIHSTIILLALIALTACKNNDWEFADNDNQAVYFAYQYPVRTIILGEIRFNNELDTNHQFEIMGTTAGVYENENDIPIQFEIDNSMVDGFHFDSPDGDSIQPMPDTYFELMGEELVIPRGKIAGGVRIQLTDAFFDDPNALKKTYVLPMRMTGVANADTILSGVPRETTSNPRRGVDADWDVLPKDFTFYAVKYVNEWDGIYLRRGEDNITYGNGEQEAIVRHEDYVVDDEVIELDSRSISSLSLPVVIQNRQGENATFDLLLQINDGSISISDDSDQFTATGNGEFVQNGAINSWGGKDRNVMYLDYTIDTGSLHIETADTLVFRDRGIGLETFTPVL